MNNIVKTKQIIESSTEVFYYLVRNYPVIKTTSTDKEYLNLGTCPFYLHESKRRIKDYLYNDLENKLQDCFKTEEQKKEVYMTIKKYIDQTRQLNNIN